MIDEIAKLMIATSVVNGYGWWGCWP